MKTTTFDQLKSMLKSMGYSVFSRIKNLEATVRPPDKPANMTYVTDVNGNAGWEERTHYHNIVREESLQKYTYKAEDAVSVFGFGELAIKTPFIIPVNSSCTINYNGKEYVCKPFAMDGFVVVGNAKPISSSLPGNDEPFLIVSSNGTDMTGSGCYGLLLPMDGTSNGTISIVTVVEELKKIPAVFLPEQETGGNNIWVVKSTAYDAMFKGEEIPDIAEYYSDITPDKIVDMLKNATLGGMTLCFYDKDSLQNRIVKADDILISQVDEVGYFIRARAKTTDKSFSITFNAEYNEYDVVNSNF